VPVREPRDYLATVARGLVIDRYRRQAIERAYLQTLTDRPQTMVISEEDKALIIETLMAVDKALSELGARTKHIFILSQIDGLTYQQIATVPHDGEKSTWFVLSLNARSSWR
jgi:RNA polymerase sigma factor (sigma-70 family)